MGGYGVFVVTENRDLGCGTDENVIFGFATM